MVVRDDGNRRKQETEIVPSFLLEREVIFVDCGARSAELPRVLRFFPRGRFIGFEPDQEEAQRLNEAYRGSQHVFYDLAVGARDEEKTFYQTAFPGASSFFLPNQTVCERFHELHEGLRVVRTGRCRMVALDQFLPSQGISSVNVLKLDVQGMEYDILRGGQNYLANTVLALHVEVEFARLYQDQPLFSDVHTLLTDHGFDLFDLSRQRYQRRCIQMPSRMRGQLLWGNALYFKDYGAIRTKTAREDCVLLALIAWDYGYPDYAIEILEYVMQLGDWTGREETAQLLNVVKRAASMGYSIRASILNRVLLSLAQYRGGRELLRLMQKVGYKCRQALQFNATTRVD